MSKTSQLFLLADHIKLSLLERRRASSIEARNDSDDGHISRSLEQFQKGLDALEHQRLEHEQQGDLELARGLNDSIINLRQQFDEVSEEFNQLSSDTTAQTLGASHSSGLVDDFSHASSRKSKAVRFSDNMSPAAQELFGPYRDDPSMNPAGYRDQAAEMTNQQLHQYHNQILEDQDEQLDRLGESIGRQREISMQIGEELDSHVAILDEMDTVVDRHESRLKRATTVLGKVAKGANENKQMTAIVVLIIILVLLIAIFK